jgi:murein DD-endopeptidase MepM/ murein hydrolase activator NlpD
MKNWKLNSVVFLTVVIATTLLVFTAGRSEALGIAFVPAGEDGAAAAPNPKKEQLSGKTLVMPKIQAPDTQPKLLAVNLKEADWREFTVKHESDIRVLASREGLAANDVESMLGIGGEIRHLNNLYYGDKVRVNVADDRRIMALEYDIFDSKRLLVERVIDEVNNIETFAARIVNRPLTTRMIRVSGVINATLYQAAINAGLSKEKTKELVRIFDCSIDYSKDIKKGDTFSLLYEERFRGNDKMEDSPILAAEFVNNDKVLSAIRYAAPGDRPRYYSPEGIALRTTFLRNPVDYPLISSGFNPARKHPTLHRIRAHKGVDYAARRGTPIKATGDGFIKFKGNKGAYGKTVIVQHNKETSTLYAHMHNYVSYLKPGDKVRQGEVIGYIGKTGRATGTHLHYEFHINGMHVDPLKVNHPAIAIPERARYDFAAKTQLLLSQIRRSDGIQVASNAKKEDGATLN